MLEFTFTFIALNPCQGRLLDFCILFYKFIFFVAIYEAIGQVILPYALGLYNSQYYIERNVLFHTFISIYDSLLYKLLLYRYVISKS